MMQRSLRLPIAVTRSGGIMKTLTGLCLFAALSLPLQPARAQEKTPDKTKAEQHAKSPTAVKVHLLFTEMDGDKKIVSLPYSFLVMV
jgi:hypothetical protein